MPNVLRLSEQRGLDEDCTIDFIGDIHFGAKACHYDAVREVFDSILDDESHYVVGMGDYIEGQDVKHPHFDHRSLGLPDELYDILVQENGENDVLTPAGQVDIAEHFFDPLVEDDRVLGLLLGNHDWRYDGIFPFFRRYARKHQVNFLGPRAKVSLYDGGVRMYLSHIGRMLTNTAGSERRLRVNQEESLIRSFLRPNDRWGSAHFMAHGHTHQLCSASPYVGDANRAVLLSNHDASEQRMRVIPPSVRGGSVDGFEYVDPDDRYYAVTGTFRRSGTEQDITDNFGIDTHYDYSDKFDYPPSPIGFIRMHVEGGSIAGIEEVVV